MVELLEIPYRCGKDRKACIGLFNEEVKKFQSGYNDDEDQDDSIWAQYFGAIVRRSSSDLIELRPRDGFKSELLHNAGARNAVFFTQTVNPTLAENLNMSTIRNIIYRILNHFQPLEFTLIPALTESLTIHWHGVLRGSVTNFKKIQNMLRFLVGFNKTKFITNVTGVVDYCYDENQRQIRFPDNLFRKLVITSLGRYRNKKSNPKLLKEVSEPEKQPTILDNAEVQQNILFDEDTGEQIIL